MSEQTERTDDQGRISSDAPAEGAENPGQDQSATTPHAQEPAEGVDPDQPVQR